MSYKDKYADTIEGQFYDLENRIMADIIRRIKKTGEITSTADWQLNRLQALGYSSEEIESMIMKALNATWPEMFELYDKVIDWEYVRNKKLYEQINAEYTPYDENEQLQQWTEAAKAQTAGTLQNLTQTMGVVEQINGQMTFLPLTEFYQRTIDAAILDITSGAFDYNSVLKRTVNTLTRSGIRTIDYASGYSSRIAVAARRAVMTSITQMTGRVTDYNAEKLGAEYFEVAWHANARPSHRSWQGKVWSKEQLVTVCGLGSVTGLCGVNCYHEYYPFFPGISERNWTDEWLREQNTKEDMPRMWRGKEYTAYEATQKQRQMETSMRAQRQKVRCLEEGGADLEDIVIAKARYQGQLQEYKRFCNDMELTPQMERVYIDGLGRVAPGQRAYEKFILTKKKGGESSGHIFSRDYFAFTESKDLSEATKYAKEKLNIEHVFYKNIDVRTANDINKAIADGLSYAPEISDRLRFIGSTQLRNTELRKELTKAFDQDLRAMYPGRNEEYYKTWSKKLAGKLVKPVKSNNFATAFSTTRMQGYTAAESVINAYAGIGVNASFGADYEQFLKFVKANVESGFHPQGTGTVKAIFDHEVGHHLDYAFGLRYNAEIKKLYNSLDKKAVSEGLSEYANKNIAEFIAEGYTEYKNNPHPREIAAQIGSIIERIVKERRSK